MSVLHESPRPPDHVITVSASPHGVPVEVVTSNGLLANRTIQAPVQQPSLDDLLRLAQALDLRGRGGAGFPFARKLQAVAPQRKSAVVVINASEGEPESYKDSVIGLIRPELALLGAQACASALGAKRIELALPHGRPAVAESWRAAADRWAWPVRSHQTQGGFISGESSAVVSLISGEPNLPRHTTVPAAVAGVRERPTLLSNAETFARVALALACPSSPQRYGVSGGVLLSLGPWTRPRVRDVPIGTPWREVLTAAELQQPVLLGGYHGQWLAPGSLAGGMVASTHNGREQVPLGAGVVIPVAGCPVLHTVEITGYLASQVAGRCGPCRNGLPTLADAVHRMSQGTASSSDVVTLTRLVRGRGACAHPDGTAGLVTSMLTAFGTEVQHHLDGGCSHA